MPDELKILLDLLPFLIPLFIVQAALMVIALVDLIKRERVRGGNKVVWALLIILVNIAGPVIYLLAGRLEGRIDSD